MGTRKIKDAELGGEKVYFKGHAKAVYMSDGRTVEDALNAAAGGSGSGMKVADWLDGEEELTREKYEELREADALRVLDQSGPKYIMTLYGVEDGSVSFYYTYTMAPDTTGVGILTFTEDLEAEWTYEEILIPCGNPVGVYWDGESDIADSYEDYDDIQELMDRESAMLYGERADLSFRVMSSGYKAGQGCWYFNYVLDGVEYYVEAQVYEDENGTPWYRMKKDVVDQFINVSGSEVNMSIKPNKFYRFGEVSDLRIDLEDPASSEVYNEYMFEFTSGSTPTRLTIDETVRWVALPEIKADSTYQCSIVNGIGVISSAASESIHLPQ